MTRFVSIAALAVSAMLLPASAATAQGSGYYTATPVAAPSKNSMITSGLMWKCNDGVCTTGKSSSRDGIVCQMVVQRVGKLSSFAVNGTAIDSANLEKCNARAK